jgi:uncharacterized protein YbjT (DUF2867 family)
MRVLLTGATGFIGARLRSELLRRGHQVLGVARRAPAGAVPGDWWPADIGALSPADWRPALQGVDVVVNCVGIFREAGNQSFDRLHVQAAQSLFTACAECGVGRVVQLSALGADADADADVDYQRSKHQADDYLLGLGLDAVVAQPSLVFAADGPSARWFLQLAAWGWAPLPEHGRQQLQPVHVDDAVAALATLAEQRGAPPGGRRVPLVGPQPLSLANYLAALRDGLGLPPARRPSVAPALVRTAARLGDVLPASLLDSASWRMLQRGNTAPAEAITALLGHAPRPASAFIEPSTAPLVRQQAQWPALLLLLRVSVSLVWLATAAVSFGLYPVADSLALLAQAGVPAGLRHAALYGAAALDLAFGLLGLALPVRHRRPLWLAQALLILGYTAIITLKLPEFWLHPYGPILKNLPMLAALAVLWVLDRPAR